MVRECKTCENNIASSEKTYCCEGCNQHMHLTTECTALSNVAINGIKELGNNCMLMCNTCLDNGERDVFIRCRAQTKVESVISDLKIDEKLSNLENNFSELVDSKLANLISKSCYKIEQNYAREEVTAKTLEKAASVVTSSNSKTKWNLKISTSQQASGYKGSLKIPRKLSMRILSQPPKKSKASCNPSMSIPKSLQWSDLENLTKQESNQGPFLLRSGMSTIRS